MKLTDFYYQLHPEYIEFIWEDTDRWLIIKNELENPNVFSYKFVVVSDYRDTIEKVGSISNIFSFFQVWSEFING